MPPHSDGTLSDKERRSQRLYLAGCVAQGWLTGGNVRLHDEVTPARTIPVEDFARVVVNYADAIIRELDQG